MKSCFCGCEQFRFKLNDKFTNYDTIGENEIPDPQGLFYNICSNCNHSLGEHITVVRSHQAE